jgi:hypothetical protein
VIQHKAEVINQMSNNILDWTLPPPHSDGSVKHESHGDESASHSEGKKRKTRSHMLNHFTVVPGKLEKENEIIAAN